MIKWLSEKYKLLINIAVFTYGKTTKGEEVIAIILEKIGEEHSKKKNKKIVPKTLEDHRNHIKIQKLRSYFIDTEKKK